MSSAIMIAPTPRAESDLGFEAAWHRVEGIDGWLTIAQGVTLFEEARRVQPGQWIVEIGSHHGKSTILLATAMPNGAQLLAVDPFSDERWGGGEKSYGVFSQNVAQAELAREVAIYRGTSQAAASDWQGEPVGMLYVDGAHDWNSVLKDIDGWEKHVQLGGSVYFHDAFSSPGVTAAVLQRHLLNANFRFLRAEGSLIGFRRVEPSALSTLGSGLRLLLRLPYFIRNLTIKVAIRRGWSWLPPLLGHRGSRDPY